MAHSVENVQQTAGFMNQEPKKDVAWQNRIESHLNWWQSIPWDSTKLSRNNREEEGIDAFSKISNISIMEKIEMVSGSIEKHLEQCKNGKKSMSRSQKKRQNQERVHSSVNTSEKESTIRTNKHPFQITGPHPQLKGLIPMEGKDKVMAGTLTWERLC